MIDYSFRTIVHWKTKDVDNILKGYKLNLQDVLGSKVPSSVLNFYFKHSFCRKVSQQILTRMTWIKWIIFSGRYNLIYKMTLKSAQALTK